MNIRTARMLMFIGVLLGPAAGALAAEPVQQPESTDWPQWRGPHRDGVAPSSPKLLDSWPKDGPPLLWKSQWIPGCEEGGCSHPVVADGKVFIYANAKWPVDKGEGYRFITDELLATCGYLADLPEPLAKKIEEAWSSPQRPASTWAWYNSVVTSKPGALDAYLAKDTALDKYINDFMATLPAEEAKKYGDYIKHRLSVDPKAKFDIPGGLPWDTLLKLTKMRDVRYHTRREWEEALRKISRAAVAICELPTQPPMHSSLQRRYFWLDTFTMSDSVFCLDLATGKTLWKVVFPEDWSIANGNIHKLPSWVFDAIGASGTPAVSGDKLYVSGALGIYCLATGDGKLLWQTKGEPAQSDLVVADGVVYDGGRGCAYDAGSGQVIWKNPMWPTRWPSIDYYRWCPPFAWTSAGQTYFITTDGGMSSYLCLEAKTGKLAWSLKASMGLFASLCGDVLIAPPTFSSSGTVAYKLTPTKPELLWKSGFSGIGYVDYQDHYYGVGKGRCVDAKTGATNWTENKFGEDTFDQLILANGKLIAQLGGMHQITKGWHDRGELAMFKATPEKYVPLGEFNAHACLMCSPAFSGGKLIVRLLDSVACYDLQDHGVYLDGVTATPDQLTFRFKQTGGGLVAKDGTVSDVMIAEANAAAKAVRAKIDGDDLIVDIKDVALPFGISCAEKSSLTGKNGKAVPAFQWSVPRILRQRKCLDNTIVLTSDQLLDYDGNWTRLDTYTIADAKITDIKLDATGHNVSLTADKTWKPGDAVSVSYASFPVSQGEPRKQTLNFTVVAPQRAAAKFVKLDENTIGNWKGVYGSDGEMISGDNTSKAPKYAIVTPSGKEDQNPWAANHSDPRYPLKAGSDKERSVVGWYALDNIDINIEITDGKEHQVALYCLDTGDRTTLQVQALDADTMNVLDTQTVQGYVKGKYLVWNLKGSVILRLSDTNMREGTDVMTYGVFFDPAR